MKKKTIKWIKLVLKYLIPIVLGWIEGDSRAFSDAVLSFISVIF